MNSPKHPTLWWQTIQRILTGITSNTLSSRHSKACISLQHFMHLSEFFTIFYNYGPFFLTPSPTIHISKSFYQSTKVTMLLLLSDTEKIIYKIMLFQFTHIFPTVLSQFFCFYALWKLRKKINIHYKFVWCSVALVSFSKQTLKFFCQEEILIFNFKLITRLAGLQRCFKSFPIRTREQPFHN